MPVTLGKGDVQSITPHLGLTRPRLTVLIVDDQPDVTRVVRAMLESFPLDIEVTSASDASQAIDAMKAYRPHAVLLDLTIPGVEGFELLDALKAIDPFAEIVMLTGDATLENAVQAVLRGASDYLVKPPKRESLHAKCAQWQHQLDAVIGTDELDWELAQAFRLEGLIGRSPGMLILQDRIRRVAPFFTNALVLGESGTGKELVARTLHRLGASPERPFVVVNCAAIPEALFESELYGYARGAFTGANTDKKGFIEAASGGTLFLDEIADVAASSQAKLLRFLQNREIQRLGSTRSIVCPVKVVAATGRDLVARIAAGQFRDDLYYRLSQVTLRVPSLADRREDLPLLIRHFLALFGEQFKKPGLYLNRKAQALLAEHSWPGNVRELESTLSYAAMVCKDRCIDVLDLPDEWRTHACPGEAPAGLMTLQELEDKYVKQVLHQFQGDREKTAQNLGIGRTTLYRKLKGHHPPQDLGSNEDSTRLHAVRPKKRTPMLPHSAVQPRIVKPGTSEIVEAASGPDSAVTVFGSLQGASYAKESK